MCIKSTLVPLSLWIRFETPGMGTDLRELVVRDVETNGLEPKGESVRLMSEITAR